MADFKKFAVLVRQNFDAMSSGELYTVNISGDELYEAYLDAFPNGTNEIYRTRREYDCSADKNFIRNLGNVVTFDDNGQIVTVWDVYNAAEHPFNVVAEKLADLLRSKPVNGIFRTKENAYGVELARELLDNGSVQNWYNLYAKVNKRHVTDEPATIKGKVATNAQVFRRGLEELTSSALESVKELIIDGMLYRGEEHKKKVVDYTKLHAAYQKLNSDEARNNFVWANVGNYVATFRNEVIGSLVIDLSEGKDFEGSVKAFESKVAPANYKRSKSLITPRMITDATKTIAELGLETALERRMARISDVSVNNVLFVDNSVRGVMKGGIEGLLLSTVKAPTVKIDKAETITIDDFMSNIVPNLRNGSINVLVKNAHQGNFMTLTAPVHDEVQRLFKWDNNFAWSYDGDIADSDLRQKVSAAGGRVDGVLRFSHMWNYDGNNQSLMDLHVFMPGNTHKSDTSPHDSYGSGRRVGWNQRNDYASGGVQDVDHVNPPGPSFVPVENITFPSLAKMPEGKYIFKIHNWSFRHKTTSGFKAEIEFGGQIFSYEYPKALKNKEWVTLAEVTLKNGVFTIEHKLDSTSSSQEKWGVSTETLVPVDTIILSPNYWDEQRETGNKHWFFILKGCKNPEPCRGIYNEFLRGDLDKHRKVFEILGDKTKCQPADDQMSGLGFSSTKRDTLTVTVKGDKMNKTYNITF